MTIILGDGVLTWSRYERIGDRYGSVYLLADPDSEDKIAWSSDLPLGTKGKLSAVILESRTSQHIGDFFRGFFPERPEVGEIITLGSGNLHIFDDDTGDGGIGVIPCESRKHDLLNPKALYRCHEQTVRLEFEAEETN